VDLDTAVAMLAPRLVAYALARTGSRADAEDVAQDALAALVRRWRLAGPPDSPEAFVFAIASRRARRSVWRRALTRPVDVLRESAHGDPPVDRAFDGRSELAAALAAMRRLRRADREALLLRAVGGLDFEEIAAVMRSTTAAVKMRVSRARRRLAALMTERTDDRRSRTA
jgi:RNA polymerase sigma-70 factor, ECF subfamily